MTNKTYDVLKFLCLVVTPLIITLINGLNDVWAFTFPVDKITATIELVATFTGGILAYASKKYAEKLEKDELI